VLDKCTGSSTGFICVTTKIEALDRVRRKVVPVSLKSDVELAVPDRNGISQ
jgi:hypothetical protein